MDCGSGRRGQLAGLRVVGGAACTCAGGPGAELWGDGNTLMNLTLDGLVFQGQWAAGEEHSFPAACDLVMSP